MQDIMERRQEKDFTIMVNKLLAIIGIFLLTGLSSCGNDEYRGEPIPYATFAPISINVSLPEYRELNNKGWIYLNQGGVRGLIVHKTNTGEYVVFDRNCSYQPSSAGATVEVTSNNLAMTDPTCGSYFNFPGGTPSGGPAINPLRIYVSNLEGSVLTITDEPLN